MAIQDNLIFRLKPEAGQPAPRNEVGANEVFAGGNFALVDRGSGNFAWELTGVGDTIATIPAITRGAPENGDLTIAVTLKIATAPTVDFTKYVGLLDASVGSGHFFSQAGAGAIRGRFLGGGGGGDNTFTGIGSTEITLVSRFIGSTGNLSGWKTTVSRVGTTPDDTKTITHPGAVALTKVLLRAAASDVVQVKAYAIWSTAKTDAECASLADSFEATIGAAPPASTAINASTGNATASGATASIQGSVTIAASVGNASASGPSATITNSIPGVTVACAVGNAAATGLTAAFGTFIHSDRLINNTGTLLPAQAVVWTWTPAGRTGSMAGITPVDGTGTTDANARLAPGIARAAGKLDIAVRAAAAVDDALYTEMFA